MYDSTCYIVIRNPVHLFIIMTSQGERVPRGMGIQYSRTNILRDFCVESNSHT